MIKVGIIGATGYAGSELVRILLGHKDVEIKWYGSRSYIDKKYASIYQNFFQLVDANCMDDNMEVLADQVDVIFTATPQGLCASLVNEEILSKVKIIDLSLDAKQKYNMIADIEKVDGVKQVLGLESIIGPAFPESMIPEDVKEILESDNYELMLIMNEYAVASDEVNSQLSEINTILKQYDPTGMLVGEAPCTKDLIEITDHDFAVVSAVSILAVFFIIFFVFKSISLPVILVMVIEGAIFINMGIPFLTGTKLPFIASIVIGTIQLGATVDYAILITSRYEKERGEGKSKKDAIQIAHKTSIRPVMVSAFSFFAATFGVGMYSQIDMISSLCLLMARGALISMCAVLLFLPAMFWLFDGIICKTSLNFRRKH